MLKKLMLKYKVYKLNKFSNELINELSITTVQKTINNWEKLVSINNENLLLEDRIKSVIEKFSFSIHANYYNFLTMLKRFDESTELKEFINEYRILIKTYNYIEYTSFLNFMNIIHSYKPAHIGFNLEINRRLHKNLYTIPIFNNSKYTNINIKSYSEKAKLNGYTTLLTNKTRIINQSIKGVSTISKTPFLNGIVLNKNIIKDVKVKFLYKGLSNSNNILILNNVKIRGCYIE